jgi:hypothetical protein
MAMEKGVKSKIAVHEWWFSAPLASVFHRVGVFCQHA